MLLVEVDERLIAFGGHPPHRCEAELVGQEATEGDRHPLRLPGRVVDVDRCDAADLRAVESHQGPAHDALVDRAHDALLPTENASSRYRPSPDDLKFRSDYEMKKT